jgi:phosphatidylserine/phosphatidylglycerophosphate/cardiolipin synthase-like enzyme
MELFTFVDLNGDGEISKSELAQRDAVYILNQSDIVVIDDTAGDSFGSALMHHKFIVIDDKKTIVTTANFTMSGIHGDYSLSTSRGNTNSLIEIFSKKVASYFSEEFDLMWGRDDSPSLFGLSKPYRGPLKTRIGSSEVVIQFSPTSKMLSWEESVNGLIGQYLKKATEEVLMALFVFSEQALSDILKDKYEYFHDFNLGLLVEAKFAYRDYSELLDVWGLTLLDENCEEEYNNSPWSVPYLKAGVSNMNGGDMLHHKYAVVDSSTVIMGSQNWSASANHSNDENVVIITNKSIAKNYKKEFLRLNNNSRLGPPKSLLRRVNDMQNSCAF